MPPSFDTNILVYFIDEPEKQAVARGLVEEHLIEGMISVLRKFYLAATRLRHPLSVEGALEAGRDFARFSPRMVLGAVSRGREMSISFWVALIVEAALRAGADRLLTEDTQHGLLIEGMRFENPFL